MRNHRALAAAALAAWLIPVVSSAQGVPAARPKLVRPQATVSPARPDPVTQLRCQGGVLPDIDIVDIQPRHTDAAHFNAGDTIPIIVFLENRGQCETGSFKLKVTVYADLGSSFMDQTIAVLDIPSLQPTREKPPKYYQTGVSFVTKVVDYPVQYNFTAVADPDDKIVEFIETNNTVTRGQPPAGWAGVKGKK